MKLKRLWINGFKNLNDFELDFTDKDGITVLIGNNGSGKSNVLEAISAIFTGLYKLGSGPRQPLFEYEIEYIINEKNIIIVNKPYKIKIDGQEMSLKQFKSASSDYLPYNVIASYSGEETRLWDKYYYYFHNDFKKDINSNELRLVPAQKLLDVDGHYWNEALLVLLISNATDTIAFIKEQLSINNLGDITIDFNITNIKKKKKEIRNNILLYFIETINPRLKKQIKIKIEDIKQLIGDDYERDNFIKFTSCSDVNYIKKINIELNNILNTEDLSEGQKKQILLKAILDFVANENSLILLDEPDSHIHIANKIRLKELLYMYKHNRDTILTTHSPSLTHTFDDKHIAMLVDGKIENKSKQEMFSHITEGIWNYQEQSVFLSSTKDIILLVEGKHDKIHILEAFKRLKEEYDGLDFDIFQMNGESNIKHMMLGLINNGVDFNGKKIIAIFDNDGAGQKGFNSNFKKIENKMYRQLTNNNGNPSDIFYAFMLPKTDSFSSDFTIENMYTGIKYKEALVSAFEARNTDDNFFNNFVDKVSEQIKLDAKNKLADNCKDFENEDFEHFKKLFDLIKEIKNFHDKITKIPRST